MRSLARKVIIDDIQPIPDADRIEVARVGGWNVVVQKGQFIKGNVALYIEVDAYLNAFDKRYEFLQSSYKILRVAGQVYDEGYRLRTVKMRGQLSQGLLLPVDKFYEIRGMAIGDDCTQALAIRHYDEVLADALSHSGNTKTGLPKGSFPSFVPKTDEERCQNLTDEEIIRNLDTPLEESLKVDGTSATFFYCRAANPFDDIMKEDRRGVCSRNLELKDSPCVYWDIEHKFNILDRMESYCENGCKSSIAIQGEISGPGIQGNPDNAREVTFQVFRIWDIEAARWLYWNERFAVCRELGLMHVPVTAPVTLRSIAKSDDPVVIREAVLKYAEGVTPNGNPREGLVFKSLDGRFSFKAVSNRYLLNKEV